MTLDVPLTPMQQRVWFVEASSPGRPDFNVCSAQRLRGPIDVAALQRAFHAVATEQGALRLRFFTDELGEVRQTLSGEVPALQVEPALGVSETQLMSRLTAIRQLPFDLSEGPLCRAHLLVRSADEAVFIFVGHHLICDGWSMMVLAQAMARHVGAEGQGDAAAVVPSVDAYLGFANDQHDWLLSEQAGREMDHWAARLTPLPAPLAWGLRSPWLAKTAPEQGSESPATDEHGGDGGQLGDAAPVARIQVPLPASALSRLRSLARSLDVSMFSVMLAAYGLVIGRSVGQRDLAIGVPVKGRSAAHLDGVIGFFANTLPVRLSWESDASFADLARHASGRIKETMAHAGLPFERLIQRLPIQREAGRHPVYQAQFSYVDLRRRADQWGAMRRSAISVPTFGGAEDLSLLLIERAEDSLLEWCVRTDMLPEELARRLVRRFLVVLDAVCRPDAASRPASQLAWLDEDESQALAQWSSGPQRQWPDACVWDLLRRAPGDEQAPALWGEQGWLSCEALFQSAMRMATRLAAHSLQPGMRVGLLLPQGPWVTQAILAVWACGAAYVPMDPSHPVERLRQVMADADCSLLISDGVTAEGEAADGGKDRVTSLLAGLPASPPWLDVRALLAEQPGDPEPAFTPWPGRAEDVAYIMFTSGSTGRPKGVVVTQGALVNLLASLHETLGVGPGDRWLAVTTPAFDIALLESLLPLVSGAALAWAASHEAQDGAALASLIHRHGITCLQGTPATWALLAAQPDASWPQQALTANGPGRFLALVGGEALPSPLAQDMLRRGLVVWNMYGPTETTVWSTCMRITAASVAAGIPVGRPIANTWIGVLDEDGQPCPPGVRGHIHIGGAGVARGYWQRDELQALRFLSLPDPQGGPRMRVFAVGDLGMWDAQGRLHCLGRLDRQIKWRGFRIEPGEVEAVLTRLTGCHAAVVKLVETSGGPRLAAFLEGALEGAFGALADGSDEGTRRRLRERLSAELPPYMVPTHVMPLPLGMPRLPNGKIDHHALDARLLTARPQAQDVGRAAPRSAVGEALWAVWREVLHTEDIRPGDNFFDLGGHSLLALKADNRMAQRLGVQVGPQKYVFENFQQLTNSYEAVMEAMAGRAAPTPPGEARTLDRLRRGLRGVLAWHKSGV